MQPGRNNTGRDAAANDDMNENRSSAMDEERDMDQDMSDTDDDPDLDEEDLEENDLTDEEADDIEWDEPPTEGTRKS